MGFTIYFECLDLEYPIVPKDITLGFKKPILCKVVVRVYVVSKMLNVYYTTFVSEWRLLFFLL